LGLNYSLSFTAGSLMLYETEKLVLLYLEYNDWDKLRSLVVEDNILQKGTLSTRKREFIELKKRVEALSSEELNYFEDASSADIKYLVLLSCFKSYQFIFDFAAETIRNKLLLFDYQILNSDYESFFESKALLHENLNTISESTQKKIKQVVFKILEQSDIIDSVKNKNIQKPYLSEELLKLIIKDNPKYLRAYLYSDNEINDYIKRLV
jgi:hypothetical protein